MKKMWMTRDAGREPILITKEELAQENLEILKIVEIKEQNVMIGHMYCGTSYVLENGEIAFNWGRGTFQSIKMEEIIHMMLIVTLKLLVYCLKVKQLSKLV